MKRYLLIEVECGKAKCKRCRDMSGGSDVCCDAFGGECELTAKGAALRLVDCLDAEREANNHVGKDVELPSEEEIEAWNRCRADAHTSPHAAEHLCEAIDLVRRLRAVRDGSTFERKVKP